MSSPVSAILLAIGPDQAVERAVASLTRQTQPIQDVIVVHDRADEASAHRRIASSRIGFEATFVSAGLFGPGAARNAGVRASRGNCFVVVDGTEDLDAHFLESATRSLESILHIDFVASPVQYEPATAPNAEGGTSFVSLPQLLSGPWSVANAVLIRRAAFDRSGGYDESLPALVEWDLLLTLAESGDSGALLNRPLVTRASSDDLPPAQSFRAGRYLPAVRRIFLKHQSSFEQHAASILTDRERYAKTLWTRERELVDRRDRLRGELADSVEEVDRLRSQLRTHGRDTTEWGDLWRTSPLSRNWGLDRGRPIDRYYIEAFLAQHASDIRGTVLEVLDAGLTTTIGGERVKRSDVLDIDPDNHRATVIADLRSADQIPSESYDCFILTQTLHLIDDMPAAIAHAHRILRPGGVLLATLPCVSMVAPEGGAKGDHWRVTDAGARRLFEPEFPPSALQIRARGNVLAATAFLYGLSCEELDTAALDIDDPAYPLIVTVRAVKAARSTPRVSAPRRRGSAILLYHRVNTLANDVHGLAVSPDTFRSQMEQLAREWHPMALSELAATAVGNEPPDGAVALTFDDGYADNLENALPILMELGLPATFFLTAEGLDERAAYWWDVLEAVLLRRPSLPPRIELRIDGEARAFVVGDADSRRASHDELYAIVKTSLPVVRDDLLRQLADVSGISLALTEDRRMSADEVTRLAAAPLVEIGAHGLHHLPLPALSPDQIHREIFECRSALERVVGRQVSLFAYPYGDLSPESVEAVRAADFQFAVSCDPRPLRGHEHPLRLPRLEVPGRGGDEFKAWLSAAGVSARDCP
jgi:peptidoglycan/xylan/chitin deacetylase (PgdA/CDA1 family)